MALNTAEIGLVLAALRKAKETIRALHGEVAWDIYDRCSPEMKQINKTILWLELEENLNATK